MASPWALETRDGRFLLFADILQTPKRDNNQRING